ncbi:MAG: hypothetical protein KKA73_15375 [Chloroflexi bacterium]|nr:hypothetical protein [Chloroflexota bacterium]MBU1749065.1 hypothetical protein [Chloroflexota bacterium]
MSRMTCPACGGLLSGQDEPCPRCGQGRLDLAQEIGAGSPRQMVLIAGGSLILGLALIIGGPFVILIWDQLGGDATWGWLIALLCVGGGLAALARGARILTAYWSWRRQR